MPHHDSASADASIEQSTLAARAARRQGARPVRARGPRPQNGYLWILPAFVLCVGIIYYAIGYSGFISLFSWDGISSTREFIGFDNYRRVVADPLFWGALRHTLIFFAVVFVVQSVMGIVFAAMLHSRVRAGVIYKILIFLPVVIAPAIMAPVHRNVFSMDGAINWILRNLGLESLARNWLADPKTALWAIIAVQIWSSIGVAFILYYAAMTQVDPETLEAARIDGAGNLRTLMAIVLPDLRGTATALAILNAMAALRLFDFPYLLTRGGPVYSSDFLGVFIYREIAAAHVGYASALSVTLVLVALAVSIVMTLRARDKR